MRILEVSLQNVKSYREGPEVAFHPGINFISGRNGAGKTTLLEAIGYALFDHKNYTKANSMLRNGEKKGRIDVTFELEENEEIIVYVASRIILNRGTGGWVIREKQSEMECASGESAVKSWIAEKLKISEGMNPAQMYSQIIGVPQGEITTYYKGTDKDRQKHFDPLMGTESYIEAFRNSSNVEGTILMEIAYMSEEIGRLEERCKDFEIERQKLDQISNEIEELTRTHQGAVEQCERLNNELTRLKGLKDELSALDKKIAKIESERERDLALMSDLENNITESQKSGEILNANREGHEKYLQATASIKELEPKLEGKTEKEEKLSELRESVANHEGESNASRAAADVEAKTIEQDISRLTNDSVNNLKNLEKWNQENDSLQASKEMQDSLEETQEKLEEIISRREQTEKELVEKKKLLDSKNAKRKKLKDEVKSAPDLEVILVKIQDIDNQLTIKNETIGSYRVKIKEYQDLQGNKGKCPITGQPCNDIDPKALKDKISKAKDSIISAEDEVKKLKADKKELEKLRREAENADRVKLEIFEIEEEIDNLREDIQELTTEDVEKATSAVLKDWKHLYIQLGCDVAIPSRGKVAFKAYLEKLMPYITESTEKSAERIKGMRKEMDQRSGVLEATRRQIDKDLKKERSKQKQNQERVKQLDKSDEQLMEDKKEIASLDAILAGLVSLDKELEQTRIVQTENAEAYKEYESNKKMALKMDAYLKHRDKLGKSIDACGTELGKAKERAEIIKQDYSDDLFEARNKEKIYIVTKITEIKKDLDAKNGEQTLLQLKLEGVEKDLLALKERKRMTAVLENVSQISKNIRIVLNDAGPLVAKRYREVISEIANNIFSSIHPERADLTWGDDYLLTLRDARGEREFNQLSGGEQMTAALAVQLALAKEFSDLGVAMFDEPTTNMDKERRGELAKIIGQLKETYGFEQLFVISHDEAFETMTEQIIRLEKEDGVTKLVEEI